MAVEEKKTTYTVIRVVNKADQRTTRVVLGKFRDVWAKPITVGRDPRCTLVIDDPSIKPVSVVLTGASNHRHYSQVDDEGYYRKFGMRTDYWPFDVGGFELTIEEAPNETVGPLTGPIRVGESKYPVFEESTRPISTEVPRELDMLLSLPDRSHHVVEEHFSVRYCVERAEARWLDAEDRITGDDLRKYLEERLGRVNERLAASGNFEPTKPDIAVTSSLSLFVRTWATRWIESSPSGQLYLRELDAMTRVINKRATRAESTGHSQWLTDCDKAQSACHSLDSHWRRVVTPTLAALGVQFVPPATELARRDLEYRMAHSEKRSSGDCGNVWHDLLEIWEAGGWPAMLPNGNYIVFIEETEATTMQVESSPPASMLEAAARVVEPCYFASPVLIWPIPAEAKLPFDFSLTEEASFKVWVPD